MTYDIDQLLRKAFTANASDLHISVSSPPVFRINGRLMADREKPLTAEDTEQMARKIIPEQNWEHFINAGEIDIPYSLENLSRYRVNVYFQQKHISIVARVIPQTIPAIENLNMPDVLKQLALKPQGLILVTGPTGSGKSSTLAAMIDYINRNEAKHIITLEDPIEFEHESQQSIISQREVGVDTTSFANGLRASLRQDPDVILLGEMRDHETIATAITAAETGHLVLATLHTSSAVATVNRIIDVFPPNQQAQIRTQLAFVLNGVISQRLLPTADGLGRIAATEILINVPSVANLIRSEKTDQINNILQTSRSQGMHTLETSIRELLATKKIDSASAQLYLSEQVSMNAGI